MKRRSLLFVVLILMFATLGTPAQSVFAATTTAGNAAELIAAINAANANSDADAIILTGNITLTNAYEASVTYGNTGTPPITNPLTIEGLGHTIARDSGVGIAYFRIFRIAAGANLTLANLTTSGGNLMPAGATSPCSTIILTCGGGAFNEGTLSILNSIFTGDTANRGGGLYNVGTANVTDSTFSANLVTDTAFPTPSGGQGGGIFSAVSSSLNISDSIITNNSSTSRGGGILNDRGNLTISGSTFSGNSASANGGGIDGAATINGSTFSSNTANIGGAVFVNFQSVTVSNSSFSGNTATLQGGAVYFTDSNPFPNTFSINGSTFSGNQAPAASGGGIMSLSPNMTVRNSIITNSTGGNCGSLAGGAVNGDGFSLTDDNTGCTGFNNSGSINLGALANNGGSTKTFALNVGSAAIDSGSVLCNSGGNVPDQRGVTRGIEGAGGVGLPQAGDCDVGAFEYGGQLRTLQFATAGSTVPVGLTDTIPVTLTLDAPLTQASAIRVYVRASGGTAIAGTDYAPFGVQTAIINPGQMTATVSINLLNPTSEKTIILSLATQNGPGFFGAAQLGARTTHTVTLKTSTPTAAANRNFYDTDTPTLTWTAMSNATGYEIQVDTDTAFLAPYSFVDTNIPAGQLSVTTTHLDNGPYYWRVRAKGGAGVYSTPERIEVFKLP